jgi:hypothetical protein
MEKLTKEEKERLVVLSNEPMTEESRKELTETIHALLAEKYKPIGRLSQIGKKCTCDHPCSLRGNCAACLAWHRDHALKPVPHCVRCNKDVKWDFYPHIRNVESIIMDDDS